MTSSNRNKIGHGSGTVQQIALMCLPLLIQLISNRRLTPAS